MNEDRISKKELLEQTGISYGQLYRWKRERLIPEEWFVKQSAFTGQETYFPREQVLTRVQAILGMKDSYSLDEMARIFSPDPQNTFQASDLVGFAKLNGELLNQKSYETSEVVFLIALSGFIGQAGFGSKAAAKLAEASLKAARSSSSQATKCLLLRTTTGRGAPDGKADGEEFHVAFSTGATAPLFDEGIAVVGALDLQGAAELLGGYLQDKNN